VAQRVAEGRTNTDTSRKRTDRDVIMENVLTFFNLVLFSLIVALLAVGEFRDGFFVGIVVFANIAFGTFQELRATHQLQSLVAITAPQATVRREGKESQILASEVVEGDILRLQRGDQVVADGPIIAGSAEIDESLLTGESDAILKQEGEEVLSGSFAISGNVYYRAERVGLQAYSLKLVADARQLVRRASPLQLRFQRLLRVLLNATAALAVALFIALNVEDEGIGEALKATTATVTTIVPEGLLLAMTVAFVIGAVRVARKGAIVQEIAAIEALNYVDVLCFDKTGTITANRLEVDSIYWMDGREDFLPWLAALASAGREDSGTTSALNAAFGDQSNGAEVTHRIAFSSERRWSGVELKLDAERHALVLGAPEAILAGTEADPAIMDLVEEAAGLGLRTVVLAEVPELPEGKALSAAEPLGIITLRDVLRGEFRQTLETINELGIQMKVISGDRPDTVAALLSQLGARPQGGAISGIELEKMTPAQFAEAVDKNMVFGRIAPQQKAEIIRALKDRGHFVAMVGDGANDVHALRNADVGVSMASGTATARAVSGFVLLNDSFDAFLAAIREARNVLGNSARLGKLFVTKSLYSYVIIVATSLLGLDYPFLPRHGSLTALLTLGIPAVFISLSVPPKGSEREFVKNVLRFALPASLSLAAAAIIVHLITEGALRRDITEARTLVAITIGFTALFFVLQILGFEGATWRRPVRPLLTLLLIGVLFAALFATLHIDPLRDFFEFVEPDLADWILIVCAVSAALVGQYVITKYWPQIVDFLAAKPKTAEASRGRPI
jgi:cation-transporting ATPase E